MKKSITFLFLCFLAAQVSFTEDSIFPRGVASPYQPPKIHTITPSQIYSGQVTELLVQGDHFLPVVDWKFEGVKILRQQYIDSKTMMLTVYASGFGLRSVSAAESSPVFVEVIPSDVLFSDDFEDGDLNGWNAEKGNWTVNTGQAAVTAQRVARIFPAIGNTDNVTIDFDLTLESGKQAGIYFHYRNSQNFRLLAIDGAKGIIRLRDRFAGYYETKKKFKILNPNSPHHYTLTINNNRVTVSVDGNQLIDEDLIYSYSGQIALYAKAATARFDNIVVNHDPAANVVPVAIFTESISGKNVSVNAGNSVDPDGSIQTYQWNFGDGSTATGISAAHDYNQNGKYNIVLSVTDNSGARTKLLKTVTINFGVSDVEAIKQVVRRFFELLGDVEHLTGTQICVDFSRNPSCPAFVKQRDDIDEIRDTIRWFEVELLSDVSVQFRSATEASPVKIRTLLKAMYDGDPQLYTTDGWHTYNVRKEADGKWHQCSYSFQEIN